MAKIGRNEPCSCGSGKKYKQCCLKSNIIPFPGTYQGRQEPVPAPSAPGEWESVPTFMETMGTPNAATEAINEMKAKISELGLSTPEEIKALLEESTRLDNERGLDDFLGLSPSVIQTILHTPFDKNTDLIELEPAITEGDLINIPVLDQAFYFMKKLMALEPLKATAKGFLPRAFVKECHREKFASYEVISFEPNKEMDVPNLATIKELFKMAGLVKIVKGKYSSTKKAEKIIGSQDLNLLYRELFSACGIKFNWGYRDAYSDLAIIQQSLIFNLYMLKKKALEFIEDKKLGALFIQAFPLALKECRSYHREPKDEISNCFRIRFLERFALYFGLVEKKIEGEDWMTRKEFYKTTPYFDRFFKWKI